MQHPQRGSGGRSATPSAGAVFYGLNLALSPVTGLGYVLWAGSLLLQHRSHASATAQGPLSTRWLLHRLHARDDAAAERLMGVLPGVPPLAPRLFAAPLLVAHHVTGHLPRPLRYPFSGPLQPPYEVLARTTFFDAVVDRHLRAVDSIVVLGAGFDTRAWRLPDGAAVAVFEVDTPATQAAKRRMVSAAGLPTEHVRFVATDFETDDWLAPLTAAGFDPRRPALFLWEGVVMYLSAAAVGATLQAIARTAPGSVVAFDYLSDVSLTSPRPLWLAARTVTRALGEPFTFGVDSTPPVQERLADLLTSCGLELGDHQTSGEQDGGTRAWGGFATALVPFP